MKPDQSGAGRAGSGGQPSKQYVCTFCTYNTYCTYSTVLRTGNVLWKSIIDPHTSSGECEFVDPQSGEARYGVSISRFAQELGIALRRTSCELCALSPRGSGMAPLLCIKRLQLMMLYVVCCIPYPHPPSSFELLTFITFYFNPTQSLLAFQHISNIYNHNEL